MDGDEIQLPIKHIVKVLNKFPSAIVKCIP